MKKYYQYDAQGRKQYVSSKVKLAETVDIPDYSFRGQKDIKKLSSIQRGVESDDVLGIILEQSYKGKLPFDTNGIYIVLGDETVNENSVSNVHAWHYHYEDIKFGWVVNRKAFGNGIFGNIGPFVLSYHNTSWPLAEIYAMTSSIFSVIATTVTSPYTDAGSYSWISTNEPETDNYVESVMLCDVVFGHSKIIKSGQYAGLRYNFGNGSVPYYINLP